MNILEFRVGVSSCGIAAGAEKVIEKLSELTTIPIVEVGCIGHCYAEPLVEVITDEGSFMFDNIDAGDDKINGVLNVDKSRVIEFRKKRTSKELLKVTKLIGKFNPVDIDKYILQGGFSALKKSLKMEPEQVITEVKESGLRGRGGGGFPAGLKWSLFAKQKTATKILICNADEGDPGAFMDRSLMESLPYQVLEGMLIAAYATGATTLFIYCRAEYPLAIKNIQTGIDKIVDLNLNNLNGLNVQITIKEGAGAFVCGEETALIHSLEGKRGMPRFRPPFPTDKGYLGNPSMINNVETFANVPLIITEGSKQYASVGTEKSKGTKLFALAGDIKFPGLVEVPMGMTLREIIYDLGGAEPGSVKAVQTGGPSGGCIPSSLFDTPVDYDSLRSLGAIMGSGGLIVIGTNRCMVEMSRYFMDFTHRESCGKCTFCRIGTKRMFETIERITAGDGVPEDVDFLEDLGTKIINGSLCGLGKTAPNPVLAAIRYFRHEFDSHVIDKQCEALECPALLDLFIDENKCTKCGLCIKNCPVNAISKDYIVDNTVCTRCNSCIEVCKKNAVFRIPRGEGYHGEKE